ncbi:ANTAR domain-containing protein [Modestobacter lacusdianchii]
MTASVDAQALAASLRRLNDQHDSAMLEASLRRIVESCVALFGVDGSGVMIADEHSELRYAVASDGLSHLLETTQMETGQGPCVDTFVREEATSCADVADDPRWPLLAPVLRGKGVAAVLGVPVYLSGLCVGSLDVYRTSVQDWDDSEADALVRYAEVVEAMLTAAVSADRAGELAAQLNYALDYRVPIERGIGYLMARDHIGHTEAFTRLRAAARKHRRKIGDVAQTLLITGRLPGER